MSDYTFRRHRVANGISLREIAAKMEIDTVLMGEYERGVSTPPDWKPFFDAVIELAKVETFAPSKRLRPLRVPLKEFTKR